MATRSTSLARMSRPRSFRQTASRSRRLMVAGASSSPPKQRSPSCAAPGLSAYLSLVLAAIASQRGYATVESAGSRGRRSGGLRLGACTRLQHLELGAELAEAIYDAYECWSGRPRYGRPAPFQHLREIAQERQLGARADVVLTVSDGIARLFEDQFGWRGSIGGWPPSRLGDPTQGGSGFWGRFRRVTAVDGAPFGRI
jgi:hypothetical protein